MAALTGSKLTVFRLARALGVWHVWDWFSRVRHGGIGFGPPWYDPHDGGHLAFGLAESVALHDDDHFEVRRIALSLFLSPGITNIPGYDTDRCFRTLSRAIRRHKAGATPYRILSGPAGVEYELSVFDLDTIAVKVVWRYRRDGSGSSQP